MKALILISSLLGPITWAQQASIQAVTSAGTGCPDGSAKSVVSPDGTELSVLFDSFSAEAGENSRVDRKNCQLQIQISVEPGWSIALVTAEHRGFVNLEQRARATHSVSYSFENEKQFRNFQLQHFIGPKTEDFTLVSEMTDAQAAWSNCQSRNVLLNMNLALISQVGIRAKNRSSATIALDSVDASLHQNFELAWRKCDTGERRQHRGRWAKRLRERGRKVL